MNYTKRAVFLVIGFLGFVLAGSPLFSQKASNSKPSFDVISIKPSTPAIGPRGGGPRGDRFVMIGTTLRTLLETAYRRFNPGVAGPFEIVGAPNWIDSDRYDIEAKADCNAGPIAREQYQLMLQSLVEDRFQMKAHLEPREVPIYELVVGKDGLKMKPSEDQTPVSAPSNAPVLCGPPSGQFGPISAPQRAAPFDPTKMRGFLSMQYSPTAATATGNAVAVRALLTVVQLEAGRPIIDKTNDTELYDFKLRFHPERMSTPNSRTGTLDPATDPNAPPAAAEPVPSLATAIQDQLGLKLESSKGQIEVLIIESAEKPKEN
jgi:uncharacterized protein (TIGR03435 family)